MSTTPTTATHHFEFFQGTSTESRTRPQITVRKGGLLVLTEAAARMLGVRTTHVQLAYDAENQAVGLRSATEDSPGSYRLRHPPKGPGRLVGGKHFFEHLGIRIERSRSYLAVEFGDGIIGFRLLGATSEEGSAKNEMAEGKRAAAASKKPVRRRKTKAA